MVAFLVSILIALQKIKKKLCLAIFPTHRLDRIYKSELTEILQGAKLTAVDVGGAVDLQPHWYHLIGNTCFYIFEPHPKSFDALKLKYEELIKQNQVHLFDCGLSGTGGPKNLFMTNTPTGAGIIPLNQKSAYLDEKDGYFFPIREIPIQTATLEDVLSKTSVNTVDLIKLDIQGAELEVLKSLGNQRLDRLLSFEMEVHLQDHYIGGTSLAQVSKFIEENGFQIFDIRVARDYVQRGGETANLKSRMNVNEWDPAVAAKAWELDIISFRKPDMFLNQKDDYSIRKLIACYCVHNFFLEAAGLVEESKQSGIVSAAEAEKMMGSILRIKRSQQINLWPYQSLIHGGKQFHWGQYMWVKFPTT